MFSSVRILFFLLFQFVDKSKESCILTVVSPVFLHNLHVFFWLSVLFTSVKHEVCGVSVLLEVKVTIIPSMTTSYFLLEFQL